MNILKCKMFLMNSIILGSHSYYKIATHVNKDFNEIHFLVRTILYNRLKRVKSKKKGLELNKTYNKLYGSYFRRLAENLEIKIES